MPAPGASRSGRAGSRPGATPALADAGRPVACGGPPGPSAPRDTMRDVPATPVEPTSRLRVVMGEEELLRARAVAAVRAAVFGHHEDAEEHELAAAGLPIGQLADVLAPSLFGGHRLVVVTGVQESAAALADALIGYAKDPDPDLTLVIVHFGGKRNEALVKAFRSAGCGARRVPQAEFGRRPHRVRPQRGPPGGGPDHPRRGHAPSSTRSAPTCGSSRPRPASWSPTSAATIDADAVARFHHGQAEVTGFTVAERVLVGDRAGSIEIAALGAAARGRRTC